eukprot:CAMPEP_0115701810 /NCGR_PEP_ID=MMETSP0272-20121206/68181_1 /TAXON_ID=71861 /ORGANISM="Scrippsiella trochoidea, Strain CCMP3099" /LENGTH=69 /DNA_ID=CAMNT_0003142467 /DNA_START=1 /DNA_END=207 /DNA_ORIENTATION=+
MRAEPHLCEVSRWALWRCERASATSKTLAHGVHLLQTPLCTYKNSMQRRAKHSAKHSLPHVSNEFKTGW